MGKFIKGDIVVVPFPFSDLSSYKKRPALVVADLSGDDLILCQITSKNTTDEYAVELLNKEVLNGNLSVDSNIRTNKIFTADKSIILYKACNLTGGKMNLVTEKIIDILKKDVKYRK